MGKPPVPVVDLLAPAAVDAFLAGQGQEPEAIPTPFPSWNRECRDAGGGKGLAFGWHITVAGATGIGKTVISLNMTRTAIEGGENVGIVSLEMSREQIQARTLAMLANEPISGIERGDSFSVDAARRLSATVREWRGVTGTITVNETPMSELGQILALMDHYVSDLGCRLLIVDYLQLIRTPHAESLLDQITTISARVREFAATRKVVTVGLSQFNRQTTANRHDRPTIYGLMGGSPLENDSDQVLLIDHTRMQRDRGRARTWLCLDKNRHGALVQIPVEFDYRTLRVREPLPDEEEGWPT